MNLVDKEIQRHREEIGKLEELRSTVRELEEITAQFSSLSATLAFVQQDIHMDVWPKGSLGEIASLIRVLREHGWERIWVIDCEETGTRILTVEGQ